MRLLLIPALLTALSGCDQIPPGILNPGISSGGSLHGQVSGATSKTRVGLLAQPNAGKGRVELSSTSASNGVFALTLNQPPISMLEQPAEDKSYVFALTAYEDTNGNGRFDDGADRVREGSSGGSYRWFANAGPSNAAGWNVFKDGQYTQAFDVAVAL